MCHSMGAINRGEAPTNHIDRQHTVWLPPWKVYNGAYIHTANSPGKYREMNKELHMVFVYLEKTYDRVPRELIWWCLQKKGIPERYVTIIQYYVQRLRYSSID